MWDLLSERYEGKYRFLFILAVILADVKPQMLISHDIEMFNKYNSDGCKLKNYYLHEGAYINSI